MSTAGSDPQSALPDVTLPPETLSLEQKVVYGKVVKALRTVFDPEIPVNILDLGLIYGIDMLSGGRVGVRMTLTSPACPEAQSIPLRVESVVGVIPEVEGVHVVIVWDPPWTPSRMSDAAKLTAGLL